ncbi:hypothetical protein ABEB36_003997 [Hypothenemus hampei]|uniref:C2H2-type domain-containing protein n=1 Tax=Hypothenemus hampei TaxID=57062 RepID=A0ABD1F1U8_HYPHA
MDDEEQEVSLFTLIHNEDMEINDESSSDNGIIYLTVNDEVLKPDFDEPISYLVQENDGLDASSVLASGIKIVTLGDQQYYCIPTLGEPVIEPHLLDGCEEFESKKEDTTKIDGLAINNLKESHLEGLEDEIVNILEPYEMAMVNDVQEDKQIVEKTKKFKCLYQGCEKSYSTSQHLTVHMRNHVNSKPFPCHYEGCGKEFATNYSLTAHIRMHTGEKPFNCQMCTKSFKTSGDLMKHRRTHTGEKPFCCPIEGCGKSFTTSNIRRVHVRSHTGERPYVCDYPNCGKAFASSTNYKNHARIHSGEKPYCCTVKGCDKKFTEYSSLYKHQSVHRVDKLFECEFCKQKFKSEPSLTMHRKMKHFMGSNEIQVLNLGYIDLASSN